MRALFSCIVLMAAAFSAYAPPSAPLPEPATLPLMAIGVAAALLIARRIKK
jgi:hypothetical protein